MLSECGQHVQHELVGMRTIGRDEIDAAFHKTGDEMDVSSEAIEFGNDQGCPGLLGSGDGSRKPGPIGSPAALDFAELPNQFARVTGKMPEDRLALGVQAKAAPPLARPLIATITHTLRAREATKCRMSQSSRWTPPAKPTGSGRGICASRTIA